MKKNIMKRAWEIARQGQKNFGGSVKMYFSESLKMAWNASKQGGSKMETIDVIRALTQDADNWDISFSSWEKNGIVRIYTKQKRQYGNKIDNGFLEIRDNKIINRCKHLSIKNINQYL